MVIMNNLLKEIQSCINANRLMNRNDDEDRFNVLINHVDIDDYETIKNELKEYHLIEVDATTLKYDQIPLFGNVCEIKLSKNNEFLDGISNNSILLIKNIGKIAKPQHRRALISALNCDMYCDDEVAYKIKKSLTVIAFVDTNDSKLLHTIRVLEGKDHFAYYK